MVDTRTERLDQIAQDYCENIGIYTAANSIRAVAAERDRLREVNAILLTGLRIIAGEEQCIDNLMSHVEIARAAIAKAEGREK